MTVLCIHSRNLSLDKAHRELLSQKLRFNLLGLKEFEQCHILARWIRKLFLLVRDRSGAISAPLRSPRSNFEPSAQTAQLDVATGMATNDDIDIVSGITSTSQRPPPTSNILSESEQAVGWAQKTNTSWSASRTDHALPNCTANLEPDSLVAADMAPLGQFYSEMDFHFDFFGDSELLQDQTMQVFADELACTEVSGWSDLEFSRPCDM